jgi:uncharacterized LabA/DUF88 family protein
VRVAVFIDGAYLNKILANHHNRAKVAFDKLAVELAAGHDLLRTYYYDAPPYQSNPPTPDESKRFAARQQFFNSLRKLPRFEVREGRCARVWNPNKGGWDYEQKRVDVHVAVDLVRPSSKQMIQRAVIIAGDSDFLPAVAVAKDEGVQIQVIHSPDIREIHRELWDAADERAKVDAALVAKCRYK